MEKQVTAVSQKWTDKEISSAENYYAACDDLLESERWQYVSEMMYCADYPKRTSAAYRSKLNKVWNQRNIQP